MRQIDFVDGYETASAPDVGTLSVGALGTYANDADYEAAITASGETLAAGYAYFNTTDNRVHAYNGSAWTVLGLKAGETFTTATLTSPTVTGGTFSSPTLSSSTHTGTTTLADVIATGSMKVGSSGAADSKAVLDLSSTTKGLLPPRMTTSERDLIASPTTGLVIYNTSTNKMNVYNQTSWVEVGSGSGGGNKNYLGTVNSVNLNGDFELGSTSGWSLFTTTLTSGMPTGSITAGAASITTFQTSSSSPLSGLHSLQVASSGAITAGEGFISDAFTLDSSDRAAQFAWNFVYSVISGSSNMNFSGTSSNTWAVYAFDVASGTWKQPAGVFNLVSSGTLAYRASGDFQTDSSATQIRLAVICINATSGAVDMRFDDFSCGPYSNVYGYSGRDWKSDSSAFSPTNFGTVANKNIWTKVEGDTLKVRGYFQAGTSVASTADITLSGYTIDSQKLSAVTGKNIVGRWASAQTAAAASEITSADNQGLMLYDGSTTNKLYFSRTETSGSFNQSNASAIAAGTGSYVTFIFEIPLLGYSSNTVQSSSTSTRVITSRMSYAGASVNLANSTNALLPFDTVTFDETGCLTTGSSSGRFTAKVTGYYNVSAMYLFATNATGQRALYLYKNGAQYSELAQTGNPSGTNPNRISGSDSVQLNANDYIEIYGFQSSGGLLGVGGSGSSFNHVTITRESGPATITSDVTVSAKYTTAAGQSIPSGTATIVNFGTKSWDHTGAVQTGVGTWKFQPSLSGTYLVSASVMLSSGGGWAAGEEASLSVYKNGVEESVIFDYNSQATHSAAVGLSGSTLVQLLAGEYFDIRLYQFSGGSISLVSQARMNHVSITRVGNY
jgi:hypothetical protein